jgi:hypothetical protein
MKKVYWFIEGASPDASFFKYGKPSNSWCMFSTLKGAYKHAYKILEQYEECEILSENASLKDYKRVLKKWNFLDPEGSGTEIIEIPIWE